MSPNDIARHLEQTRSDSDLIDRLEQALAGVADDTALLGLLAVQGALIHAMCQGKAPLAMALWEASQAHGRFLLEAMMEQPEHVPARETVN